MNNFNKLKVSKPKQGGAFDRGSRKDPWTFAESSLEQIKSPKKTKKKKYEKAAPVNKINKNSSAENLPSETSATLDSFYTKQDNDFYSLALKELTPTEERVYQRLFRESWGFRRNTCKISNLELAAKCYQDPRNVRRIRDSLIQKGWIEIVSSQHTSISTKQPLIYRVYAAREIIARREGGNIRGADIQPESTQNIPNQGLDDRGYHDPGHDNPVIAVTDLSQEYPQHDQNKSSNPLNNLPKDETRNFLKKEEENKEKIPPLNPPQGGGEGDLIIPTKILKQAEELTEKFYAQMNWPQQTERIRQSDIASIVHWHHYERFSFDVIERAIAEVAKKADTRSLKRAEFYLAPLSKTDGSSKSGSDEKGRAAFEEEARQKEERVAKLERIKKKVSDKEFQEIYQNKFDELQGENPSIPIFILETLARQKTNQSLLEEHKD